ncbi:MAG: hypothetical protein R3A52_06500 [Polyangiales bacterium]
MGRLPVWAGARVGAYGYDEKPWFLPDVRLAAFERALAARGLASRVDPREAPPADDALLTRFHTPEHVARVTSLCAKNEGALDHGATFARAKIESAARHVVGAVDAAVRSIARGETPRAFVPISGFHHAHADEARMYCLYNDAVLGVMRAAETHAPVAYVDIDAHFGDGVYRAFASDPRVLIVDVHQEGRTLWPHSPEAPGEGDFPGERTWVGDGEARGTKLNLPLPARADDGMLRAAWAEGEAFLDRARPRFVVFECGVDGLAGDPMASLGFSVEGVVEVLRGVRALAERHAEGRLLVLGGGGYNLDTVGEAWASIVEALVE